MVSISASIVRCAFFQHSLSLSFAAVSHVNTSNARVAVSHHTQFKRSWFCLSARTHFKRSWLCLSTCTHCKRSWSSLHATSGRLTRLTTLSPHRPSSVLSPYSWALWQGCSVRSCSSLWTCHPKHIYKTPIILYSTLFTHYIYMLAILLIQRLITILISTLLSTTTLSYIQLQLNSRYLLHHIILLTMPDTSSCLQILSRYFLTS